MEGCLSLPRNVVVDRLRADDSAHAFWQVYATAHSFLPQLEQAGVKDSAHCLFTFPSGAVFTLEMTRCSAYGYDNRIEVRRVIDVWASPLVRRRVR